MTENPIKVVLVDDSAVIRSAMKRLLDNANGIKVIETASNGEFGLESVKHHKPDIVILDVEMPVMDGLTALPKILQASPDTKVIMFSSLTEKGAEVTLKALSLGASECFAKPASSMMPEEREAFERNLVRVIKSLANASPAISAKEKAQIPASKAQESFELYDEKKVYKGKPAVLAIGSSTGGPKALMSFAKNLKDLPIPIVITQHMPATFTTILAQHLQQSSGIPCTEGENGMALEAGKAYLAPGGYHMKLKQEGCNVIVHLDDGPQINFCRPSVDPMFDSLHEIYGNKILLAMLTGMGHDGLESSRRLVKEGCPLVAQDEATSVVWGMPGAVAKAGLCIKVLPLEELGPWVRNRILH